MVNPTALGSFRRTFHPKNELDVLFQSRFYKEGRSLVRRWPGGGARGPLRAADWLEQMPVPLPSLPVSGGLPAGPAGARSRLAVPNWQGA